MPLDLLVLGTLPPNCKICGGAIADVGAIDFDGDPLDDPERAEGAIALVQCADCGFAWAPVFDNWTDQDFATHIYNRDYHQMETAQNARERSQNIMARLNGWFPPSMGLRTLDYGCGPGVLVEMLQAAGYEAEGYDRFEPGFEARPTGTFDMVTCYEVLEHANDPVALVEDLTSFLRPGGVIAIGTFLAARPFDRDWWYCQPRKGHICFHTEPSLHRLFGKFGRTVASDGEVFHCAFNPDQPALLSNVLPH